MTERIAERNGGGQSIWLFSTLPSALFATLTVVLVKIGIDGVNGTFATATRTAVVFAIAWGMVFLTHAGQGISAISQKSWLFLILLRLATGVSWLCYYHAPQLGCVNQVASIDKLSIVFTIFFAVLFLREEPTPKNALGCVPTALDVVLIALWFRGAEKRQTENCR